MAIEDLKTRIARLPEQPGVYVYGNASGDTIYVGKARIIRDRVRSYLGTRGSSPKADALLDEIAHIDVIVTDSVVEALALENNLIKERAPKYNIKLRDDKTYPYLRLTTSEAFPRVEVARRVASDGDHYAGPFMPASLAWRTRGLSHKLFGIRSCREVITGNRGRPCLEYDIKRCLAPCVSGLCSQEQYGHAVRDARLLLDGRTDELIEDLESRMYAAADEERYEQAAQLRDTLRTLETLRDRQQKMAGPRLGDRDAIGLRLGSQGAIVQVFQARGGRVVDRIELVSNADQARDATPEALLDAALLHLYADHLPPPEVLVPLALDDMDAMAEWLAWRGGRPVVLTVPQRGDRRALLDLAERNAQLAYDARFNAEGTANYEALETLQAALALPTLPRRIECFDISTLQGAETVASLVVCEDGRMKRSAYRTFKIRAHGASAAAGSQAPLAKADDFAAMRQVVERRYRGLLEREAALPDLILIDGGKGQLSAAYDALEALGLTQLVAIGLAKEEELVFARDRSEPIDFGAGTPALRLLQRIRDEAHRFAVTFHRASRTRRDLQSELDGIDGIGVRRRNSLLRAFGSVAGVRRASREDLTTVVGARAADAVLRHFAG
jgi:excinuclease ABC subunit C